MNYNMQSKNSKDFKFIIETSSKIFMLKTDPKKIQEIDKHGGWNFSKSIFKRDFER